MQAYIKTKQVRADGTMDSFHTESVPAKEAPTAWQLLGLQETATGYGKRLTTRYMVQHRGKWRRVYCCIYSNIGTCYIGKLSDGLIVTHLE